MGQKRVDHQILTLRFPGVASDRDPVAVHKVFFVTVFGVWGIPTTVCCGRRDPPTGLDEIYDLFLSSVNCGRTFVQVLTPLASAVWPHRQPFHHANQSVITQRLTPSPPFDSVSKVRTLHAKVPCVALVNPRLEALCRSGVPAGCPVF